jgi:hypothetical protein
VTDRSRNTGPRSSENATLMESRKNVPLTPRRHPATNPAVNPPMPPPRNETFPLAYPDSIDKQILNPKKLGRSSRINHFKKIPARIARPCLI